MKRYNVEFSEEADNELFESYIWGSSEWGVEAANRWVREFRTTIFKMLGSFPVSQPLAPDNDEYEVEVRQLIVGRYRVLFTIHDTVVIVLNIRGPYTG